MADLEKHAIKRDRRFIFRLVVLLVIAVMVGLFIWAKMTSTSFGNCAAGTFGSVAPASQ